MADEADDAAVLSDLFLKQSLASVNKGPRLAARGSCHYCESDFAYDVAKLDQLTNEALLGASLSYEQWYAQTQDLARKATEGSLSPDEAGLANQLAVWGAKRRELAATVADEGLDALTRAALHGQDASPDQYEDRRAELAAKRLYCDGDCAKDHEYEQKVKARR